MEAYWVGQGCTTGLTHCRSKNRLPTAGRRTGSDAQAGRTRTQVRQLPPLSSPGMNTVVLRPVTDDDLAVFEARFYDESGTGEYQWFGHRTAASERKQFVESGLLTADGGQLTVLRGDEVCGRVSWFRSTWGRPDTSWCWSISAGLLPECQGKGIGTAAQRLLAEYLFLHTRAERVQAWTDVSNVAEQKALERAGFLREGVLRAAQWRAGGWRDQVVFARLRSDM